MDKGLEISFKVPGKNGPLIVEALANIVGNEFLKDFDVQWRIFDVTLDKERFYKICFSGHKLTRLHPHHEEMVKKRFDELAHCESDELLKRYRDEQKGDNFELQKIQEKKEEYDLWQDNFWQYF